MWGRLLSYRGLPLPPTYNETNIKDRGMRESKKHKPLGRLARPGRVNKVGQSWRSEFVPASHIITRKEIKVATGPARCSECKSEENVIAYNKDGVPICLNCGLSYEPRPRDHVPQPRNKIKRARRFLKRVS